APEAPRVAALDAALARGEPAPAADTAAPSANVAQMTISPAHDRETQALAGAGLQASSEAELLARHDVLCLRAANPGPLTLSGTNTWLLGSDPAWIVDPGPPLDEHLRQLRSAIEARGGLGGVVLTHDHHDHCAAVPALLKDHPAPLAGGRGEVDVLLGEGVRFGPFEAVATPGHAADHFALIANGVCFTGDAVLGEGSVFISPHRGAMSGYLLALERLRLRADVKLLCPGHGPIVRDAQAKLREYIAHRAERESRLMIALSEGRRTTDELLEAVWPEVSEPLRPLAAVTLAAHLDKLEDEQRLPAGVQRATFEGTEW
ncbi:MAG: MBL fold metallo-hydrolase, partial [Solirubrobacteraceae bacterium]